jgi:hypothetical protein
MTMYLPNSEGRPVGWEPLEFLDLPTMAEVGASRSAITSVEEPMGRLSDEIRSDLVQHVYEHLSVLVEDHDGDLEDVRLIVRSLFDALCSPTLPTVEARPLRPRRADCAGSSS